MGEGVGTLHVVEVRSKDIYDIGIDMFRRDLRTQSSELKKRAKKVVEIKTKIWL
jgi:hypothetical protein